MFGKGAEEQVHRAADKLHVTRLEVENKFWRNTLGNLITGSLAESTDHVKGALNKLTDEMVQRMSGKSKTAPFSAADTDDMEFTSNSANIQFSDIAKQCAINFLYEAGDISTDQVLLFEQVVRGMLDDQPNISLWGLDEITRLGNAVNSLAVVTNFRLWLHNYQRANPAPVAPTEEETPVVKAEEPAVDVDKIRDQVFDDVIIGVRDLIGSEVSTRLQADPAVLKDAVAYAVNRSLEAGGSTVNAIDFLVTVCRIGHVNSDLTAAITSYVSMDPKFFGSESVQKLARQVNGMREDKQ